MTSKASVCKLGCQKNCRIVVIIIKQAQNINLKCEMFLVVIIFVNKHHDFKIVNPFF